MTAPDQVVEESVPVGEGPGEVPVGPKIRRFGKIPLVLNCLLALAALYTLYLAKTILMPVVGGTAVFLTSSAPWYPCSSAFEFLGRYRLCC